MAKNLPPESLFKTALMGSDEPWSQDTHLLAGLVDAVNYNTYSVVKSSGGKIKVPSLVRRPKTKTRGNKNSLFASMARRAYTASPNAKG